MGDVALMKREALLLLGLTGCGGEARQPWERLEGADVLASSPSPQGIVPGFDLSIALSGDDIDLSWHDQGLDATYEVWRSTEPYFVPDDGSATLVTSTGGTSHVDVGANDALDYYYRVRAIEADGSNSDSTTVGKTTTALHEGYTNIGMCLVNEVDTAAELFAEVGVASISAHKWDEASQGWTWSWATDPGPGISFSIGEAVAINVGVDHPQWYTSVGYVPTREDVTQQLLPGLNIVTMLPFSLGEMTASELHEIVPDAESVQWWDPATQSVRSYAGPSDDDFTLFRCGHVKLEVSQPSTWPPAWCPRAISTGQVDATGGTIAAADVEVTLDGLNVSLPETLEVLVHGAELNPATPLYPDQTCSGGVVEVRASLGLEGLSEPTGALTVPCDPSTTPLVTVEHRRRDGTSTTSTVACDGASNEATVSFSGLGHFVLGETAIEGCEPCSDPADSELCMVTSWWPPRGECRVDPCSPRRVEPTPYGALALPYVEHDVLGRPFWVGLKENEVPPPAQCLPLPVSAQTQLGHPNQPTEMVTLADMASFEEVRPLSHDATARRVYMALSQFDPEWHVETIRGVLQEVCAVRGNRGVDEPELGLTVLVGSGASSTSVEQELAGADCGALEVLGPVMTSSVYQQDPYQAMQIRISDGQDELTSVLLGLSNTSGASAVEVSGNDPFPFITGFNGGSNGNMGGNVEPLPDGRILIGSDSATLGLVSGLQAIAPIVELPADFLTVGHIDEYISVMPSGHLAYADPLLGINTLYTNSNQGEFDALFALMTDPARRAVSFMEGWQRLGKFARRNGYDEFRSAVEYYLVDPAALPPFALSDFDLSRTGSTARREADNVVRASLGLAQMLEPVLAGVEAAVPIPELYHGRTNVSGVPAGGYGSLFPSIINAMWLDDRMVTGDPFMASLRTVTEQEVNAAGYSVGFVDIWAAWAGLGGLHCVTNVARAPHCEPEWVDDDDEYTRLLFDHDIERCRCSELTPTVDLASNSGTTPSTLVVHNAATETTIEVFEHAADGTAVSVGTVAPGGALGVSSMGGMAYSIRESDAGALLVEHVLGESETYSELEVDECESTVTQQCMAPLVWDEAAASCQEPCAIPVGERTEPSTCECAQGVFSGATGSCEEPCAIPVSDRVNEDTCACAEGEWDPGTSSCTPVEPPCEIPLEDRADDGSCTCAEGGWDPASSSCVPVEPPCEIPLAERPEDGSCTCAQGVWAAGNSICVECVEDTDCVVGEICDGGNVCVECTMDADCGVDEVCGVESHACECVEGAGADASTGQCTTTDTVVIEGPWEHCGAAPIRWYIQVPNGSGSYEVQYGSPPCGPGPGGTTAYGCFQTVMVVDTGDGSVVWSGYAGYAGISVAAVYDGTPEPECGGVGACPCGDEPHCGYVN